MTLRLNPNQNPMTVPSASATEEGLVKLDGSLVAGALHNEQDQGTLDIGGNLLVTDGPNANTILAYQPGETDATKWTQWIEDFANAFGSRLNQVRGEGWNRGPNGKIDPLQGSLAVIAEARYQPTNLIRNLEWYLEMTDEGGGSWRPIMVELNVLNGLAPRLAFGGSTLHLQTSAGVDLWTWNLDAGGFLTIESPITPIFLKTPLIPIARQQSNLGAYSVDMIRLNAQDEVELGVDIIDTRVGRGLQLGLTTGDPARSPFIGSIDGSATPVAPANEGRQRYNNTTKQWEESIDGGDWNSYVLNKNITGTFPGDLADHVLYSITPGANAFGQLFGIVCIFATDLSGSQQYTISAPFTTDGAGVVTVYPGANTFGGVINTGPSSSLIASGTEVQLVGNHNVNCKYAAHLKTVLTNP